MSEPEKPNLIEGWNLAALFLPMLEADGADVDLDEIGAKLNAEFEPAIEALHARIAEFAEGASVDERIAALEFKVALLRSGVMLMGGTLAATTKRSRWRSSNLGEHRASAASSDSERVAAERLRSARLRMLGQWAAQRVCFSGLTAKRLFESFFRGVARSWSWAAHWGRPATLTRSRAQRSPPQEVCVLQKNESGNAASAACAGSASTGS
jgi:hypothetical protein